MKDMTEQEWLSCTDPMPMFSFLRGKASERKLRLFAYAVCVQIVSRIGNDCSDVVAVAERYAGGQGDDCDLLIATAWLESKLNPVSNPGDVDLAFVAVGHVCLVGEQPGFNSILDLASRFDGADLLRCMFNPFRLPRPLPSTVLNWNDCTIPRIAQGIYDARKMPEGTLDNARLAILADALLDAGCEDEAIIHHCRELGSYVQGCWAVDAILAKE